MQKWEEVWKKQFGSKTEFAFDFTGQKIQKKLFQKDLFSSSWDIYYVEDNKCIIVSSKVFKYMPINWKKSFFFNDKEYQFVKNKNNEFEIFLLKSSEDEENELRLMHGTYSINVSEFIDNDHNDDKIKDIVKLNENLKNKNKEKEIVDKHIDKHIDEPTTNKLYLSDEEKKKNFRKRIVEKNYKIWESLFGDDVIATDFTGHQIIKYEFDMGTKNSWKVDNYNIDQDDEVFIAYYENIDKRAGRMKFEIDSIEYNIVVINGKYQIVSSREKSKILLSPVLLFNEIEKYFPSFLTDHKSEEATVPYYSSLLINFSEFPIDELEKLRIMLQKLLKEMDIFQDIFIYLIDKSNPNPNSNPADNCYIRIFFKSDNLESNDLKIFNISIILKNALAMVIDNIRTIYNLTTSTNYTMFLNNYNKEYEYISWFTSHDIDDNEDRPKRLNRGELIVDKFYYDLFINTKGYKHSFIALRSKTDNNSFICNIDVNNMTDFIQEKIIKNKHRNIRQ
ncbi:MAG: hypothetical protein ACRC1F_01740 [Metamycoplasmataceae bacterium]